MRGHDAYGDGYKGWDDIPDISEEGRRDTLPVGGEVIQVAGNYLQVKGDDGRAYALRYHGQVHMHVERRVSARVTLRWLSTASGAWWVACPPS